MELSWLLALGAGVGLLAYFICWFVIPMEPASNA